MELKYRIPIIVISLLSAYALGRYNQPESIKTDDKTVKNDNNSSNTKSDLDKHKETTITEKTDKDGTKTKTTKIVEDDTKKTDTKDVDKSKTMTEDKKEVINSSSKVTVSALAGTKLSFSSNPIIYGASITKPILGPLTVGIWGLSDSTAGCSIGLTF